MVENNKNQTVPFTHFFFVESGIYNFEFIKMLDGYFDNSSHRLVFASKANYEQCKYFGEKGFDCIYDPEILSVRGLDKYYITSEFCLWHSKPFKAWELVKFKNEWARKTIWCVWGHDLYDTSNNKIKKNLKRVIGKVLNRKVSSFKMIIAGYEADSKEILNRYGNKVPIYNAIYPQGHSEMELDDVCEYPRSKERTRVLLGHSCYSFLKHEKWLRELFPYRDKIELVIPLSYGDSAYGNQLESLAKELWHGSVEIYREFIPPEKYLEILKGIDAPIFDFEHQAAYGTILLLLYFGKRCYLSEKGIMYHGLRQSNLEVFTCRDILKDIKCNQVTHQCRSWNTEWARKKLCTEVIKDQWMQLFQNLL